MAQIQPEEIVDHLRSEMRRALEEAVNEVIPNAKFDRDDLFRAFRLAVRRKCRTWEQVPDHFVKVK
jgi:hypothetical protein